VKVKVKKVTVKPKATLHKKEKGALAKKLDRVERMLFKAQVAKETLLEEAVQIVKHFRGGEGIE
jgi:hypothetical protein